MGWQEVCAFTKNKITLYRTTFHSFQFMNYSIVLVGHVRPSLDVIRMVQQREDRTPTQAFSEKKRFGQRPYQPPAPQIVEASWKIHVTERPVEDLDLLWPTTLDLAERDGPCPCWLPVSS